MNIKRYTLIMSLLSGSFITNRRNINCRHYRENPTEELDKANYSNNYKMKYKNHIFVCINEREDGRKSCGEVHGMALVNAFKDLIKGKKLNAEVRAQKAGCFDVCNFGPAIVVYPEGIFYGNVQLEDVKEIFEEHLVNNRPVERLKLIF
jgi:(2Fe-2S) ferredoxin